PVGSPVPELVPADPGVGVSPVLLPVVIGVHVTHLERRTIRPDPRLLELFAAAAPATAGEPRRVDFLRAGDQFLELLVALAKEDAMPVLAIRPRNVLGKVSEQEIGLAPEHRPAV